jgi:hypothetical protein
MRIGDAVVQKSQAASNVEIMGTFQMQGLSKYWTADRLA